MKDQLVTKEIAGASTLPGEAVTGKSPTVKCCGKRGMRKDVGTSLFLQ